MKVSLKSILLVLVLLATGNHLATAQYLPLNSKGKCEVAAVVLADSLPQTILYSNQKLWLNSLVKDAKLTEVVYDSLEGKTSANLEVMVYSQTGVLRKTSGTVTYHIQVETKAGKYRYTFSEFVFHYYAQNRNYKMVATGKLKPFEESKAAGWQKLWTQHRATIATLTSRQVADLKTKIIETPQSATKAVEKKVEW